MRLRVLALASYPIEAASSRYRIVQFIEPLAERGIDVEFKPLLDASLFAALYSPKQLLPRLPRVAFRAAMCIRDAFRAADVVLVQREAMLFGPPFVEWLARLRRPLVLDLDDATYLSYVSPVYGRVARWLKWPGKTDRLIDRAHIVICGNPTVAAYASARGAETAIVPTIVDTSVFHPREPAPRAVPVIGWIGTHATFPFLARLLPLFERLAREQHFRLRIIGSGRSDIEVPGVEVETRPWRMDAEAEEFRALDVGLYPLDDDAWNAGKSGLKAVQYLASGVPFVMSPVGICATIGIEGHTHFAATTDDEWLDALRRLAGDAELRANMGRAGRVFAERTYSIDRHADALADILRKAAS